MDHKILFGFLITVLFAINGVAGDPDEDIPHNEVRNWALKLGVDLWEFGKSFTRISDIKSRFKENDFEVVRKDGLVFLREMAAEVKNFMDFKMSAVMRIMDSAEQAALSESDPEHQAQKSHSNIFYDARRVNVYDSDGKLASGAKHMLLRHMKRFEGLPVNVSLSSVLFANNVDLSDAEVQSSISWSSHLDPLFANNLEKDSALSWQFFGSKSGFLRRFPGTAWPPEGSRGSREIHDFRNEDWFIQAASSPKDIIILLDSSSSISTKEFALAKATAFAILDTLGDDDYVNLITFSDVVRSVVPCFSNKMVRATPDNKREFRAATNALKCENTANFSGAIEEAFDLLHRYNVSGQGSQCNQAIMLISDGPAETHAELIKRHNFPHMPVRIFTYHIGKDSGSAENLNNMACQNKGFYAQITSTEDIKSRVLEYALVMARPMVLYLADHPVHWSPVFVGGYSSLLGRDNEGKRKLVTTVSIPVFDRRNHSTREANLLGVVGTDVPIEEIQKVIPRHKLGTNGYSFIVDNNGRLLYHPDLRPIDDNGEYMSLLKPKYHSIDLTEVEIPEIELSANGNQGNAHDRMDENTQALHDMRQEMVAQKEGEMELTVLTHMDDMKRVALRTQKYFYGPIEGTQYSLAVTLPERYGLHEFVSQQEIRHSHVNVTEYFKGHNWKVHPDFVYCEYNSLKDMDKELENSGESYFRDREDSFDTPEEQVMHFLARAGRPGWKWMSLRARSPQPHHSHSMLSGMNMGSHYSHQAPINQNARKAEPYYCDRTLVQSLVRDAMVTETFGQDNARSSMKKEDKQQGYQMFGVKTSFIATRSGLLRWKDHINHSDDALEPHFAEANAKAMDTSWYKRAVDHHSIEPDSFVFSVPFDSGYHGKNSSVLVTAAHAMFIEHRGHKAPAAVVGLQYTHESLAKHFINITSACTGSSHCRKTCASDELDCYLLDNNGFVLLSERTEHTGKFFGQIDGTIMDSLVQDRIFRRVGLMDYQGICSDRDNPYNAAGERINPIQPISWFFKYAFTFLTTWLSFFSMPVISYPTDFNYDDEGDMPPYDEDYEQPDDYISPDLDDHITQPEIEKVNVPQSTPPRIVSSTTSGTSGPRVIPDPAHARPCDLKTDLYLLQPDRLNSSGQSNPLKGKLTNCHSSGCERPFSVQKIPHSNLILLVVDTLCPCGSKQLDIEPQEVPGGAGACGTRRLARELLPRKRPPKCINYHPEEIEINQCGRGSSLRSMSLVATLTTSILMLFKALHA
ncbi:hypothetical protein PVAND_004986 [Polypedilum vanderplanki]|uniref:VWFA domain-containing protein n=1 Tax=Polypedilum vanderplanki TaxID=319348 RepID=A0A9J6BYX3_POLVA|nr:hypothetical protein PVAND_004986 [Polypedilum vanderplanki]